MAATREETDTMSFALELARRASAIKLDTVPTDAVRAATYAIADTLGVALAGSSALYLDGLAAALGADGKQGSVSCIGRGGRYSVLHAALLNGTAAHALDFDDCSTVMFGHPSAPVVAALLALAEERGASGGAVLEAYLAGVEVEMHLARAVMPHHYDKGWHPTATLGVFGVATASARLLNFDEERLATALAVAVSMASGIKSNFGSPVKPLHVGQAAFSGILAAQTVRHGMTSNLAAFEHTYGFFNVFDGAGRFDADKALEGWGDRFEILYPGIAIKQHPCCGSAHSAIDAALSIQKTLGKVDCDAIAAIEIWTHERRLAHTDRPTPSSGLDAKFSVQFLTAKALLAGMVSLRDFDEATFMTPDVAALLPRVVAHPHQEASEYLGRVRVVLKDGTVLEDTASTELGRNPFDLMASGELERKFLDCTGSHLAGAEAGKLFADILDMQNAPNIVHIVRVIAQQERAGKC
jgi:2-methylcitrate dehydratase PrpD